MDYVVMINVSHHRDVTVTQRTSPMLNSRTVGPPSEFREIEVEDAICHAAGVPVIVRKKKSNKYFS